MPSYEQTPDDVFDRVVGLKFSHRCHKEAPELLVVNFLPHNSPFVTERPVDRSFERSGYLHFINSDETFPKRFNERFNESVLIVRHSTWL